MKAELHCTVDVSERAPLIMSLLSSCVQKLCDDLWDICDKRKNEWVAERERIMTEKWLEDHLGLITNTYLSIMQA